MHDQQVDFWSYGLFCKQLTWTWVGRDISWWSSDRLWVFDIGKIQVKTEITVRSLTRR